jgi:hypothetical protein
MAMRALELFANDCGAENGWVGDEDGVGIGRGDGIEKAILRVDQRGAPPCAEARGFNGMPKIGIAEELAHQFGGNQLAELELMGCGKVCVIFGGKQCDAMTAGTESDAHADKGQDITISAERGEKRVHSSLDYRVWEKFYHGLCKRR